MDRQSCSPAPDSVEHSFIADGVDWSNPALLVASETNPHPLDQQSHAQEQIHHAVEKFRLIIIDALHSSADADLQRRAEKMGLCCVAPMIFADSDSKPVCVAGYCRDRLCPTCMRRRAFKVRVRLIGLVSQMNAPRFMTLTERDNSDPLKTRLDRMSKALQKLRRTDVWKRHVKGGVVVWETTRNKEKVTWHPHLHLIVDGEFFPQAQLHDAWKAALGGDGGARMEACHDRVKSARYIAKYLAKDADLVKWGPEAIREFALAMHRRRLIATFGRSHRVNLDLCDEEPPKPKLPRASISYGQMRDAISAGVEAAEKAAPLLARMGIAFRQLFFEWSMPGDCYADEIPLSELADFGRWIEEVCAQTLRVEDIDPVPPPIECAGQLEMFKRGRKL